MVAKAVCPGMVSRGQGVVAITGATASLRGRPMASAFAPAKVRGCLIFDGECISSNFQYESRNNFQQRKDHEAHT